MGIRIGGRFEQKRCRATSRTTGRTRRRRHIHIQYGADTDGSKIKKCNLVRACVGQGRAVPLFKPSQWATSSWASLVA